MRRGTSSINGARSRFPSATRRRTGDQTMRSGSPRVCWMLRAAQCPHVPAARPCRPAGARSGRSRCAPGPRRPRSGGWWRAARTMPIRPVHLNVPGGCSPSPRGSRWRGCRKPRKPRCLDSRGCAQRRPCRSPQRQTGPHHGLCARVVVVECARQRAVIFEGPHGVLGQGVDGAASDQKSCGSCVRLALSGALTAAGRVRLRNRENSQAAGGKRALHRGSGSRRMPMRSTYSSTSPTRPTAVAASSAVGHIHGDAVGPRGF